MSPFAAKVTFQLCHFLKYYRHINRSLQNQSEITISDFSLKVIYLYFYVYSFGKGRDRNLLSDSEADTSVFASLNGDQTVIEL